MRKLLFILFILSLSHFVNATTIYVSTTGNDGTGTGSSGSPYASLYKASTVAGSGDLIHIVAGSYNETSIINVGVGVDIEGEGQGISIVNFTLATSSYPINFSSTTQGTNGNQTVKNLTFTGTSLTGKLGIYIGRRSNVSFTYCTVRNFLGNAFYFEGQNTYGSLPTTFATGNELGWDSIINCSDRAYAGGMIGVGGQDGLSIHDCYLNQTARPATHNGDIVGGVEGQNKNLQFYNNTSIKPDLDSTNWDFHLEMWNTLGGNQVYNNTFIGGIILDIGGDSSLVGSSTYSWSFHDNNVSLSAQLATGTGYTPAGITLETYGSGLVVYNNIFTNVTMPISVQGNLDTGFPHRLINNIHVYNNLFNNCGYAGGAYFSENVHLYATPTDTLRDVYIDNNTFYNPSANGVLTEVSFSADSAGIVKNINFRNNTSVNAISGFLRVRSFVGTIDSILSNTNIVYGCGNSNNIVYDLETPTNVSIINSIKSNPLLNGSYLPGTGSPALGAALNIGLPTTNIGYYGTSSPIANAGPDQTIYLTQTSTATLNGSGSSGDTYQWTDISANIGYPMLMNLGVEGHPTNPATITSSTSATATVTGLVQGVWYYQIAVTTGGITAYDTTVIRVDYDVPPANSTLYYNLDMAAGKSIENSRSDTTNYLGYVASNRFYSTMGDTTFSTWLERARSNGFYIDTLMGKEYSVVEDGYAWNGTTYNRSEKYINAQTIDSNKTYCFEWKGYFPQSDFATGDYTVIWQLHGNDGYSPVFELYYSYASHNIVFLEVTAPSETVTSSTTIIPYSSLINTAHTIRINLKEGMAGGSNHFIQVLIDGVQKYYRNTGDVGRTWQADYPKSGVYDWNNSLVSPSNHTRNRKFALVTESFKIYQLTNNQPPTTPLPVSNTTIWFDKHQFH